jgi:cytochrome c-type biogenesis protein CcmH/NrfG
MYGEEPWFDRTHSIIFDWLVAAGFLGLIAYLLIPVSLLTHLWVLDPRERTWSLRSLTNFSAIRTLITKRDQHFSATERALWTGLIAAYMFHNLFVFDNIISYILFFSVLAYIHWRVTEGHDVLCDKEVSDETVTAVALPVVLVVAGLTIWYVNIPGIKTSQAIINAIMPTQTLPSGQVVQQTPENILAEYQRALEYDQLGRQEVREQIAQMAANMRRREDVAPETRAAFGELAVTEMERELERNPNSARLWLFMGPIYSQFGTTQQAEAAFARAVEVTPTKQVALFQYAEMLLIQGKNDEALVQLKKAFESAPEYDDARKIYAVGLIRSGQDKVAVDLLTERWGTAAIDDTRLFMAWTEAQRYDIAAQILEARVEKNPEDVQQRVSLAAAYKELGQSDKAIALLEDIVAENPEYAEQMQAFIKDIRGW